LRKEELHGLVPRIIEDCVNIFHTALQETADKLHFSPPDKEKDALFLSKVSEISTVVSKALAEPALLTKGIRFFLLNYTISGLSEKIFDLPGKRISQIGVQVKYSLQAKMNDEKFQVLVMTEETTFQITARTVN